MKTKIIQQYAHYARSVERLLTELEAIPEDVLNRKPAGGGWSALQTLHHVMLAEAMSFKYVQKKLGFQSDFDTAGWNAGLRSIGLWIFLNLPFKFKAPAAVAEERLPERSSLTEVRSSWAETQRQWRDFFEHMQDSLATKAVYKHPRAGRLSWLGTINFFVDHFERHTHQVRRAIA